MKKLLFACFFLLSIGIQAQNYKNVNGTIVKVETATKVKTEDKVYAVKDGITFYQGAKGGIYFWVISKTGKKYKKYVSSK